MSDSGTDTAGIMQALVVVVAVILLGFMIFGGPGTSTPGADIVFTNAKVYTVNEKQPWADAVAVRGNKIVYVGDAEGVKAYVDENTETYDLAGKMLLPGFVSGHDHLIAS